MTRPSPAACPPSGSTAPSRLLLACGLGLAALRFALELAQGLFVLGDSFQIYSHFSVALGNVLAAGELPLWLPYAAYGAPAAPYNQVFLSPFNVLAALAGGTLGWSNAWALFLAGVLAETAALLVGAWLLAGELYESRAARWAVVLGAALLTSWQLQMFWSHRMVVYWPLLLFFTLRLRRTGDAADLAAACLVGLFHLFGSVTYTAPLDALLVLVLYAAAWRLLPGPRRPLDLASLRAPRSLALWAAALACVGAYGWIAANMLEGVRVLAPFRNPDGTVPLDVFLRYAGPALDKLPELLTGVPIAHLESYCYLGVMACSMILYALWRGRSPKMLAMLILAVFALLLCLGPHGLVAYGVYYLVPLANRFRHLGMLLPLVRLLWLFVAGFGIEALAARPEGERGRVLAVILAAGAVMVGCKWLFYTGFMPAGWRSTLAETGTVLALGALLVAGRLRPQRLAWAAALVVVLELALAQTAFMDDLRTLRPANLLDGVGMDLRQARPLAFNAHRVAESKGDPRWQSLIHIGRRNAVNNVTLQNFTGLDLCVPIFRVDYAAEATLRDIPGLELQIETRSNINLMPQDRYSGFMWLPSLRDGRFRDLCGCGEALTLAVRENGVDALPEVLHYSNNRVVVRTRSQAPDAVLRQADSYDPRWTATIDDAPAPVEDAHPFRLVRLPAGEHVVELRFRAPGEQWVLSLAGVGAALALGWLVWAEVRRR